jgi:hypothetical protein
MRSRLEDLLAVIFIGDGVLSLIEPERHSSVWSFGPKFYRDANLALEQHPAVARTVGLVWIALGACLAMYGRQGRKRRV